MHNNDSNNQLKILYVAPCNYTGTLEKFVEEHRKRGNIANFVTLTKSPEGFDNGLCLNLRPNGLDKKIISFRNILARNTNIKGERAILEGEPPIEKPTMLHSLARGLQDRIYEKHIYRFIKKHNLLDYDIYHLESGIDFFKDYRILPELKKNGKKLIANYHGSDFRNIGVNKVIHTLANCNTTSEWDVFFRYPGCHYTYLPMNFIKERTVNFNKIDEPLVICHMVRTKGHFHYKGTDRIVEIGNRIAQKYNCEFKLLYGLSHAEALEQLSKGHILIDQIGGKAGYGYGMTAVEALSMGLIVAVEIQPEMKAQLIDHPFIEIDYETIEERLSSLLTEKDKLHSISEKGYLWAKTTHSIEAVVDNLYKIYETL